MNRLRSSSARWLALAGFMTGSAVHVTSAHAEPVLDRALSGLRVLKKNACVVVKIDFNFRIQYGGHFPVDRGDELRISVRAIDRAQAAALGLLKREALRAPDGTGAGIKAIDFEANQPGGPALRIQFDAPTAYQVAPGSDFESVIVAIAGKAPSSTCKPEFPARQGDTWNATVTRAAPVEVEILPSRPKTRVGGKATQDQVRQAAAAMDEARAALKKSNYADASRLLGKVLSLPENEYSAEAQEMLGVTRQKAGQLAEARAEYEDYLVRYSSGEGAERVRQRLAGILTAQGQSPKSPQASRDERASEPGAERTAPGGTAWSVSGSASSFYIRDDSFRKLRDPSLPPEINGDKDDHRVHQNVLLSSVDLIAAWHNSAVKSKFRFSGTEEHGFNNGDKDIVAVAALNLETTIREWDLTTRIGRQTRNTGGVLGRFDGGLVSWQANPFVRFNVVGGSPVERRKDTPFKDDKYFYGASVDFGPFWGGLETSLFAIEQRDRSWLDRQAIGAELRYVRPDKSLFATVDYDTHFSTLNAAIASGSLTFADKSTLTGAIDYRRSPYLSAWTALQGQPFLTLYDMLKIKTKEEVDQLAIDRTATYKAATVGYSRPLTDKLQWSVDGTVADISGTISSGGVDATLPPGKEYFASTQLIGTSVFSDGDMYIAGLRYAHHPDSNLYVADISARYPLTADLRINPRLRVGYRVGDGTDLKEWSVLPSILLNYNWTKDLSLELEVGTQWTRRDQLGVRETSTDVFFTAGIRYDFYADGKTKCAWPLSVCRSQGDENAIKK